MRAIGSISQAHGPARSASPTSSCKRPLQRGEPVDVGVAELDLHLGAAGDDRRRVRLEQHAADRPHRARAGDFGKPVVNARREPHHRDPGIPAPHHARRAGMVLLADQRDPVVPDADDRLDDADAQSGRVERVALLDMRFEIADIARRIDPLARPSGKTGAFQRLAQRRPVIAAAGLVDLVFGERVGKRAAAEIVAVMAFLVRPGDDLDAASRIVGKDARELQPIDDAERAVEPAAIGLGFAVRADQQTPLRTRIAPDHIADAVDHGVEPGLAKLVGQPMPRLDIDRRIGRAVNAGLVAAEFGKPLQIGDNALSVDLRHVSRPFQPPWRSAED